MQISHGGVSRRSNWKRWSLVVFVLASLSNYSYAQESAPEIILKNGKILKSTPEAAKGYVWAEALSISKGVIQSIGDNKSILKEKRDSTRLIDLQKRVVIAGFNDTQIQFIEGGLKLAFPSETFTSIPYNKDKIIAAIKAGQHRLLQFGITSIHISITGGEELLKALTDLTTSNELILRIALYGDLEHPEQFLGWQEKYKNFKPDQVQFTGLKAELDGDLPSHTASLMESYSDKNVTVGEPKYTQEKLNELVLNANRLGLPVALKASGDHAVGMAMLAIRKARTQLFNSRIRNRIEQIEVVPSAIYSYFNDYHVIAAATPQKLQQNNYPKQVLEPLLGKKRVSHSYSFKNFIKQNATLAFGTNWPEFECNPFLGILAATHKRPWHTDQKIEMFAALQAFTMAGAYATHEEHLKGSIREGKFADVIILQQDPFHTSSSSQDPIYMTIGNGKIHYDASVPMIR